MTETEVLEALGSLVGITTGWTDEAVTLYTKSLMDLNNADALRSACNSLAHSWTEARRPPLGLIQQMYRRQIGPAEPAALPAPGTVLPPLAGVPVARQAYVQECKRLGRKPNLDHFDAVMAGITGTQPQT